MQSPHVSTADPRAAVVTLARHGSIELSGRQAEQVEGVQLAPGTPVFIAWVPGTPLPRLVQAAARVRAAGWAPVPHVAARQFPTAPAAEDFLARLRGEADVTRVLAIAGDGPAPRGPYASSIALLETGLLPRLGFTQVFVAGYPEGHPALPEAELHAALQRKLALVAEQGLALGIVSQFAFDAVPILAWVERLRRDGVTAPVHVGVAGPATLRTLLNYGMRCGVGNSLRVLGTHTQSLAKLLSTQGPEAVVSALAPRAEALGIVGLHLFAFGGFPRAAEWLAALALTP